MLYFPPFCIKLKKKKKKKKKDYFLQKTQSKQKRNKGKQKNYLLKRRESINIGRDLLDVRQGKKTKEGPLRAL